MLQKTLHSISLLSCSRSLLYVCVSRVCVCVLCLNACFYFGICARVCLYVGLCGYVCTSLKITWTLSKSYSLRFFQTNFWCLRRRSCCCLCCGSANVATELNSLLISYFLTIETQTGHNFFYYTFNVSFLFACLSIVIITIVFGLVFVVIVVCVCWQQNVTWCGAWLPVLLLLLLFIPRVPFCREKNIYVCALAAHTNTVSFNAPANFLSNEHHLNNIQSLVKHTRVSYFCFFLFFSSLSLCSFLSSVFSIVTRGATTAAAPSLRCFTLFWVLFLFYFYFRFFYSILDWVYI